MFRFIVLALILLPSVALSEPRSEPLVDQVRIAIERGVRFLRREEGGKGHWERGDLAIHRPGGSTTLAMLALLNSGVPPDDPMIRRGLNYLRNLEPKLVYVVGLQTMIFVEAGDPQDRDRIQRNVQWLLKARSYSGGRLQGWTYSNDDGTPDNSNSQYALLGLHAGHNAGAKIDLETWKEIREFYQTTQSIHPRDAGGWSYHPARGAQSTLTMTIAGLCGLQICASELNKDQQVLLPDGSARNCGVYEDDEAIQKAMQWLNGLSLQDGKARLRFEDMYTYYNCYGIERAGRLTGQRFLGGRDWYREGCEYLLGLRKGDDNWPSKHEFAGSFHPIINTSFALLFLSKGRTPVLISKWAYGAGDGWNNKHYDAKHLVEFASKELFKKQPLAWQVYDLRRKTIRTTPERLQEVGALLQSPIVYINGHNSPTNMTPMQKQVLKQYIEEGGFVLAEACCGKAGFYEGFHALIKDMFKDHQLKPLSPQHPIWRSWAEVPPDFVPLEGLELGCKTVVVLSPKPLAGYWEANMVNEGRGKDAFRLAGNIIAYATGGQLPNARGTIAEVVDTHHERQSPRGFFQVAQLQHEGDWHPAPRAMRNLMVHLRTKDKLDVALQTEELPFNHPDLFKFKFLYLHGRGRFTVTDDGLENLRSNLASGALLLADACCGSEAFDKAFREFAGKLFPNTKLEPIPVDDVLYSTELNGMRIDKVRVRTGGPGSGFDNQPPALEGIKVDGRWVVIYSKYDLGCALEKHVSGDCKGHDYDSAVRLASAAVLYSLKEPRTK